VSLAITSVAIAGNSAHIVDSLPRSIPPGSTERFAVDVQVCAPDVGWWQWFVTPASAIERRISVRLAGRIVAVPDDELARIGIDPRLPLSAPSEAVGIWATCGAPMWLQLALVGFVIGSSSAAWRVWFRQAAPLRAYFGKVNVSTPSRSEVLDVPRDWGRSLVIGNVESADIRSSLGGSPFAVALVSRKPRFPLLRPKRGLYAYRLSGAVTYQTRRFDKKTRRWTEMPEPLGSAASSATPVSFRTTLGLSDGVQRVTIGFKS
jgi:hypothetical protein